MLRPELLVASVLVGSAASAAAVVTKDFSAIRSVAAARRLTATGDLVRVLFFPAELGGPDVKENRAYITPAAAAQRERAIERIAKRVDHGDAFDRMDVRPEYRGDSIVPTRIILTASHSAKPGTFEVVIDVW